MRKIIRLTGAGVAKLERHLVQSGNQVEIPFAQAVSNLIEVVTPQVNNKNPELAVEPWYFAIGVAGTTYPKSADEHETSDYEEICLRYNEADFQIENTAPAATKVVSDIGPSWSRLLPDAKRWACEIAALARGDMEGQILASIWPYRDYGDKGCEMLSVDMVGSKGGDFTLTFGAGRVDRTDYGFSDLRKTCFQVPDLTEAFSLAAMVIDQLAATVTLPNRS